ncbi:MAG: hypothetical protein Kow009_01140 [Spirochaetales bacterium]
MSVFHLQNPSYGYLAGILLLVVLVDLWAFPRSRSAFLRLAGSSEFIRRRFLRRYLVREGTFILSLLCVLLAVMGIGWGTVAQEDNREGLDVVFILDVSRSMLARDVSPSRLAYAKSVALSLVTTVPDARFGVVLCKGTAIRAIPVTEDRQVLEGFLKEVNPSFLQSRGSNLAAGIEEAARSFPPASFRYGAIILLSDGESFTPVPSSLPGDSTGIPVFCVGVGTVEGAVIPDPEPVRGKDGKVVITKLNRSTLQRIAEISKGFYLEVGDEPVARTLWERLQQVQRSWKRVRIRMVPAEKYELFLALSLFFLLIHIGSRIWPWRFERE